MCNVQDVPQCVTQCVPRCVTQCATQCVTQCVRGRSSILESGSPREYETRIRRNFSVPRQTLNSEKKNQRKATPALQPAGCRLRHLSSRHLAQVVGLEGQRPDAKLAPVAHMRARLYSHAVTALQFIDDTVEKNTYQDQRARSVLRSLWCLDVCSLLPLTDEGRARKRGKCEGKNRPWLSGCRGPSRRAALLRRRCLPSRQHLFEGDSFKEMSCAPAAGGGKGYRSPASCRLHVLSGPVTRSRSKKSVRKQVGA